MKLPLNTLLILTLLIGACGQRTDRAAVIHLKAGLDSSNRMMQDLMEDTYGLIADRWNDPITHAAAETWDTRVRALLETSRSCTDYIDSLAAEKVRGGAALATRLSHFDSVVRSFQTQRPISVHSLPDNFDDIDDTLARQAALSRIKSDILIAEYTSLRYCLQRTRLRGCIDYGPMAMLNGGHFRKGDTIQVAAWVGAIQSGMDVKLLVNGSTISQTGEDPATYKFVAQEQPGQYDLPIRLQYRRRDGTMGIADKTFKYHIIR